MLPHYKHTARFVSQPLARMKKPALAAAAAALVLLFVFFLALSGDVDDFAGDVDAPASSAQAPVPAPLTAAARGHAPTLAPDVPDIGPDLRDTLAREAPRDVAISDDGDVAKDATGAPTPASSLPWALRLLLPLVAGYCFGFLGSVPIAGPTSAMVLKLGIQGKYQSALTIAVGGAISEATYAGIAFWGFGSFLAGAKFLLPVSKVLGAVMFTAVGVVFLRSEMKPSMKPELDSSQRKGMGKARDEVYKNILLGITMSGINPALLATYTGAIASVYGTGMLEFNLFLALVFGLGVCSGVSSWFYLLLSLLKKYKQRLKDQTISMIMRCMGCFLLTLGLFCAKSSFDYFVWGPPTEGK